jgi:hypothetical protein
MLIIEIDCAERKEEKLRANMDLPENPNQRF